MQIKKLSVVFVQKSLSVLGITPICARQNVKLAGAISGIEIDTLSDHYLNQNVVIADNNLQQKIYHPKNITQKLALERAPDDTDIKEVFNLTVEDYGVYYANDILVSNCDTLAYAVNIGLINKSVIYTVQGHNQSDNIVKDMMANHDYLNKMRNKASWHM